MLILFNVNTNSSHLYLKVMKFIIFLILSISGHLTWLFYQPATPLILKLSTAQPAQRIAINIVNSKMQQPTVETQIQVQPVVKSTKAANTQFSGKKIQLAAKPQEQIITTKSALSEPTIKQLNPVPDKPVSPKKVEPPTKVKLAIQQKKPTMAAPSSSTPVIAKQHSLKNQVIDVNTLPLFKAPRPALNYPRRAKRRGYQGVAILQIELSEKGLITNVKILKSSGFAELDKAAIGNVSKWQFHPVMRDSHGIKARFSVPIEFSLRS